MPDDDVIARGRAIFDRLRSEDPPEAPDAAPEREEPATTAPEDATAAPTGPGEPPADSDEPAGIASSPAVDAAAEVNARAAEGEGGSISDNEVTASPEAPVAPEGGSPAEGPPGDLGIGPGAGAPPAAAGSPAPAAAVAATPGPGGAEVDIDASPLPVPDLDPPPDEVVATGNGRRPKPPLPRILAIANQKGGVGKTTTAVNLSAGLAELGYRVLVVDLDPQGNATTGLGINGRTLDTSIYDVLIRDAALEDCVEPTSLRNLFVVPATIDLAGAEIELVPAFSRELKLRRALEAVRDDFDFVLIDCPPSLGLLTINAFSAASEVAVPIQCEYYALEGLGQLLRSINLVQANLNPTLELGTIILTMFDARTKLAEQVATQVREHFGDVVCRNVVPRTVRLSEAPSFGQPITVFDPSSRGAIAYRELAKEVSGGAPQRTG